MHISYSSIINSVSRIISKNIGIDTSTVLEKDNLQALGMDQLDLVNLILAVEKKYHITIPDEVPLQTVSDLAQFVFTHNAA